MDTTIIEKAIPVAGTLIGVVLGFILNELAAWRRISRDERQIMRRALAELLELRHVSVGLLEISRQVVEALDLKAASAVEIHEFVTENFIDIEGLRKRYADVCQSVSGVDPLLGYRMRGKDMMLDFLPRIRKHFLDGDGNAEAIARIQPEMSSMSRQAMDDTIRDVASALGRKTLKDVENALSAPFDGNPVQMRIFTQALTKTT